MAAYIQENFVKLHQAIMENIEIAKCQGWPLPSFKVNSKSRADLFMFGVINGGINYIEILFPSISVNRFQYAGCEFTYDPSLGDSDEIELRVDHHPPTGPDGWQGD